MKTVLRFLVAVVGLCCFLVAAAHAGAPEDQRRRERISELITRLSDKDSKVRGRAASLLGEYGPEPGIVPALSKALRDEDDWVRSNAAGALREMGEAGLAVLMEAICSRRPEVRANVALGIHHMGKRAARAAPLLVKLLSDESGDARKFAGWGLANHPGILPEVAKVLREGKPKARAAAAESLGRFGKAAVQPLVAALKDPEKAARVKAAEGLGRIGVEAAGAASALIGILGDQESEVRTTALASLGKVGGNRQEVTPVLLNVLSGQDAKMRAGAAQALGNMGRRSEKVVAALLKAMKDEDKVVRCRAAEALGKLGPGADVVEALLKATKDEEEWVRNQAVASLGKMGAREDVIEALTKAVEGTDYHGRLAAMEALAKIGPEARSAVPAIIKVFEGKDGIVRSSAAYALARFSAEEGAVEALAGGLNDPNPHVRSASAGALAIAGVRAKPALEKLLAMSRSEKTGWVRSNVMSALGEIGAERGVLPALIKGLNDREVDVRWHAARGLMRIGPAAAEALPALERALKDEHRLVRKFAREAIRRIRAGLPPGEEPAEVF